MRRTPKEWKDFFANLDRLFDDHNRDEGRAQECIARTIQVETIAKVKGWLEHNADAGWGATSSGVRIAAESIDKVFMP